ncbi:MAG: glutamine synthetase type III, partial [Lachnospiraceae bacterium]|nr:glutamine synthetase type III [Lachnospiraceae bacterium]
FLGDELSAILDAIESDTPYKGTEQKIMKLGVDVLPAFPRDNTDRNRTSPFAFTGNKFEFRSLGSSNSIACANIMLNTVVAESLKTYADRLEGAEDFEKTLHEMIKKTIADHKRILFNGNGYDDAWVKEATEVRGLCNYRTTPDCMPHILDEKNVKVLTGHGVFTEKEIESRCEIMLENYCKQVRIEANTMIDMAYRQVLPAVTAYADKLSETVAAKKAVTGSLACSYETTVISRLSVLADQIYERTGEVEKAVISLANASDIIAESAAIRDDLLPKMGELRAAVDEAETLVSSKDWPYPSYGDMLFSVR